MNVVDTSINLLILASVGKAFSRTESKIMPKYFGSRSDFLKLTRSQDPEKPSRVGPELTGARELNPLVPANRQCNDEGGSPLSVPMPKPAQTPS